MTSSTDLLRMDDVARHFGSGLHPKPRAALEADLRWPSKAAAPLLAAPFDPDQMPENLVSLADCQADVGKRRA